MEGMSSSWVKVNKVSQATLEEYFASQCLAALKGKNNEIFIEALEKAPSLVTKILDDSVSSFSHSIQVPSN